MLRVTCQRLRGGLPLPLVDLILISSYPSPLARFYHIYRPPARPDATRSTSSEFLSKITEVLKSERDGGLTGPDAEDHNRRLSALRLALGSTDLPRIRNAFQDFTEHSSMGSLTVRDLEMISRILQRYFSDLPSVKDAMAGAREMAMQVAAHGQVNGLKACMLLYLRNGDLQGVSSTYDEYCSRLRSPSMSAPSQTALSEETDESENVKDGGDLIHLSEPAKHRSTNSDLGDLFLTVTAAYAIQDRFDDAFDRFMVTPMTVRITTPKVKAFCEAYLPPHDLALSEKIRTWSRELVLLRLVSRGSSFQTYVNDLANNKHITSLLKLYSNVMSECRKLDGRLVVSSGSSEKPPNGETRENRLRKVVVSSDIWSAFIQAFFKCNRADLAESLRNDVVGLGLSPNRHMWTTLLDGYGRQGQCDKAMSVWNRMLEAGTEPNEISYGAMIHAYFNARRPQEGFALFEQFQRRRSETAEGKKSLKDPAMLPLYNILLHGLCTNAMDGQAQTLMKEMMDHGPKPDIVSYNTFLRHYSRRGDMKRLASVLRALKPANVQPDVHSFTTVLSALYKGGKRDAHTRLIQVMESMGVRPNVAMYSSIIDFLVRQGGQENFRNANSLLHLMEASPDKETRPNEITYTGILAGLHRDPTIPVHEVELYREDLFTRMHKNGTQPNRTTYHYLIKASLENPESQGLQMGLKYYREMGKRGFTLTNRTWYVILSALLRRGDWGIAGEIVNDMFRTGYNPDGALVTLVQKVRKKMSLDGGFVEI